MNHYCCIISSVGPEGSGTRYIMLVAKTSHQLQKADALEWSPQIVGTVTSRAHSMKDENAGYAQAYSTVMCQQIEQAMRRGSFPNLELIIPDALVREAMMTSMPEPIGYHPQGMIVYSFSI